MTEQPGLPFERRDVTADDVRRNGAVPSPGRERLSAAISELLRKEWVDEEPGERCFDHDETRMARLLSFLDRRVTREEADDVKDHLVECPRCRFIYLRVRKDVNPSVAPVSAYGSGPAGTAGEPIPDILRTHLRSSGPVVFPGGKVAQGAWEFGQLGSLTGDVVDSISDLIAERAWGKLRSSLPREDIVLVCFSSPVHRCGKRLARKMVEASVKDVHVVMADDFFTPTLWCDPDELKQQHVIVFVDVVHTGGLLNRLYAACREAGPRDVTGIAVIDQSSVRVSNQPFHALWKEPSEERMAYDSVIHSQAKFFDPAVALSRPRKDLPKEIADPTMARATVECHLTAIEPLARYIEATAALRRDAQIGGVYYPWAVDLLRLLRDDEARAELASRAAENLSDLRARGPWCLIYPAERYKRAGAWAELIATTLGWPVVKVGLKARTHYRQLTAGQWQELVKCPRAVVVDAAIRTGKTLQSLVNLLRCGANPPAREISAFYAFDGLFREPREELEKSLNVEVRSLFRLPLGAPTEPVGRHCRRRMTDTLRELAALEADGPSAWVDIVRSYCEKKLQIGRNRPRQRSRDNIEGSLRSALDEGERGARARLEQSCHPPSVSLVKHLDVEYALGEPRTRNVLHGFLCNSMPPDFIEWCALALATQKDYDWLDRDWLTLHKRLFTNAASPRWQFLACISYWIRQHGEEEQVRRVRDAVDEFQRSHASAAPSLFADLIEESELPESLEARCKTLISVLSDS